MPALTSPAKRAVASRTAASVYELVAMPKRKGGGNGKTPRAESYRHTEARSLMRPEVGAEPQFNQNKKNVKPPKTYRYDSSLSPALEWDGQNAARELGEALIRQILEAKTVEEAKAAAEKLKALSRPFLNWAGKAERLSFDVPTLPLFIHERLSTEAIIQTLTRHKRPEQGMLFNLWGDPQHSIVDQVLKAYEHQDNWVNRLILGDNLVVMNSLLHRDNLGGQVQMIYMDPPYGVKFGSNFQPFVRKRDVTHNDDKDMTREPEMVKAFRDTWEMGLHSYLTCLRDRLLMCRELLHPTGSIFVQINDENLHHMRELLDDVFGPGNFCSVVTFKKTSSASGYLLSAVSDYLLWYARDKQRVKYRRLYQSKEPGETGGTQYTWAELPDGSRKNFGSFEVLSRDAPAGSRIFRQDNLTSQRPAQGNDVRTFTFQGREFTPGKGTFKTDLRGLMNLAAANRLIAVGKTLSYVRYLDDFPVYPLSNAWEDTAVSGFAAEKLYVVQTNRLVIHRCLLMTTDPGDLVLDPTCGSGTMAYVAEQWGRRWITIDVSRVPLALTRQRLLTATFPWYELRDDGRGPASGFTYERRQNKKGEEIGGIVPHITLKSIASNEPPEEEVLVDRPEVVKSITRVTGPFVVEATIPTPAQVNGNGKAEVIQTDSNFPERMLEVLRRSPVLRLEGNQTVKLQNVRRPAKTLSLSAEAAVVNGDAKPVAFVFGPENDAVSEGLVQAALKEANLKNYAHLYVIGFLIHPNARLLIENSASMGGVPATYVQATPDLTMGDLLKNMRSSQIFSVCGLPEVEVKRVKGNGKNGDGRYQAKLLGLDVFDPVTMEVIHRDGKDVPAWFLDTDYDESCFNVSQAFFPRTGAWDNLKRSLRGEYDETVWDHLAGDASAPFEAGDQKRIAVKVIDDRGNELLVVKSLNGVK